MRKFPQSRHIFYILIFSILIGLVAGCSGQNLPPEPPRPGEAQGNIGGQAFYAGISYSNPTYSVSGVPVEFLSTFDTSSKTVTATSQDTAVYKYAYMSLNNGQWQPVDVRGNSLGGNWLKGPASATFTVPKPTASSDNNAILLYTCRLVSGAWDCAGNSWQATVFSVRLSTACNGCLFGETCYDNNAFRDNVNKCVNGNWINQESACELADGQRNNRCWASHEITANNAEVCAANGESASLRNRNTNQYNDYICDSGTFVQLPTSPGVPGSQGPPGDDDGTL